MHLGKPNQPSLRNQVPSVKLSVEALPECRIQKISLDGTETYYRSLTMSEHLCKMASKLDFLAEEEGRASEEDEEDESSKKPFQNQRWPWEPIHNRLRQALTEITVLTDVLSITHSKGSPKKEAAQSEGKYMMFDQVRKELSQTKLNLLLPAKKKGLLAAAEILLNGEKRMKGSGESNSPNTGYHHELLRLRKYWRIRKVGVKVLGDLSYRTVGSDFPHGGNFEVIKTTDDDEDHTSSTALLGRVFSNQRQIKPKSPLRVVIGSDLKGVSTVKFGIVRNSNDSLVSTNQKSFTLAGLVNKADPDWHKLLCFSQNVLYCRELFERLAQQAVQFKTNSTLTPFWVVGNKITATILPGTDLVIELITDLTDDHDMLKTDGADSEGIFSLKMAAMQLLLEEYQKIFNIPTPHPAAAVFGLSKMQRKAATAPFSILQMQRVTNDESKSLLEKIVDMAKHWELKNRVCDAITTISAKIQDPYIQAQWSTFGNAIETSVRITILGAGYENCSRTLVDITVGTDSMQSIQKDGKVIELTTDCHHLQVYLLSLLCFHQLSAAQDVCLIWGWRVQYFSHNCGIGPITDLGSVSCLMAVSPMGNCSVSFRCWVSGCDESLRDAKVNYLVKTQIARPDLGQDGLPQTRKQHLIISEVDAVQEFKWSLLGREWEEVDLTKLFGRHFTGKFESLLTFLTTDF